MPTDENCWYSCIQRGISMITVHCFTLLYVFCFFFLPHPTQETCLPAGRGSAQRRLQPVRKNSHLAPHASLHHPTLLSLTSPALPPWHPSLLFSSATLLFLPFDSDHWVSLRLLCLTPHFARQMDRRREDGLTSRYACVFMRWKEKKKGRRSAETFLGGKNVKQQWSEETFICQTCMRSCLSGYWVTRLQLKESWDAKVRATEWVYLSFSWLVIQYQPYLYMPYFTTASVLHQRISFKSKAKKQKTVKCLL